MRIVQAREKKKKKIFSLCVRRKNVTRISRRESATHYCWLQFLLFPFERFDDEREKKRRMGLWFKRRCDCCSMNTRDARRLFSFIYFTNNVLLFRYLLFYFFFSVLLYLRSHDYPTVPRVITHALRRFVLFVSDLQSLYFDAADADAGDGELRGDVARFLQLDFSSLVLEF